MKIILASSSKQRQDILKMIGLKYEIITSNVDECSIESEPDKYVEELSLNKAKSVSNQIDYDAIIIAADTIVYSNNKKYEKPKTKEDAYSNLKELSGTKNSAYTGITIIDLYKNKTITFSSKVDVYFKNILDNEIDWYINNEDKLFKNCGYVPLGKASLFIDRIDGDYNTLLGISPSIVFEKLKGLGYSITDFDFEKGNETK
ncbi:MAG: septum formation protein Maf [Bacilli bacterium]|nr:septum formation protein Maf [Bacilli bacterium]